MDRRTFYQWLDTCIWYRHPGSGQKECGHTLLYRPDAITRPIPKDRLPYFLDLIGELQARNLYPFLYNYWNEGSTSITVPENTPCIFEGYAIDPYQERKSLILEDLSSKNIYHTPPFISSHWLSKLDFRKEVKALYGPNMVTPGITSETYTQEVHDYIFSHTSRLILKKPGAGGSGNKIFSPQEVSQEDIQNFLGDQPKWLVCEELLPHKLSPCTSYFLSETNILPLEVNEQIQPQPGSFRGSYSYGLSVRDKDHLFAFLYPLVYRMQKDGVRGFIGIDVILDTEGYVSSLLPDSGLMVKAIIEVNPRLNGHNQACIFLSRIARRDGISLDDLHYVRVPLNVSQWANRQSPYTRKNVEKALLSTFSHLHLLPPTKLMENIPYMWLDCCYPWESDYDGVMIFGYGDNIIPQLEELKNDLLNR